MTQVLWPPRGKALGGLDAKDYVDAFDQALSDAIAQITTGTGDMRNADNLAFLNDFAAARTYLDVPDFAFMDQAIADAVAAIVIGAGAVSSVNALTGDVVIDFADVGADVLGAAAQALLDAKAYADLIASGFQPRAACRVATAAALPACTYANGTLGVGATLTATANGGLTVDTVAVSSTPSPDRVLVKNQAAAAQNGIYDATQAGSGGTPWILTRAVDADESDEAISGMVTFILDGTAPRKAGAFVQLTPGALTIGTSPQVFDQSSATTSYTFSNGLVLTAGDVSPTYGTGAGTIAQGNDSRFTDARTPIAHKVSHQVGGADELLLAESQVTNLTSDLAGKLAASDNLAALANKATSRTNLGVAYGTTAGTVAEGNDSRFGSGGPPTGTAAGALAGTYPNPTLADAELNAIGGLTSAADKGIQFTGSGTAGTFDLTTAGKALIDDADATAQRTTLGLGNVDNTSDVNKPVSTAQTTALNLKANLASPTFTGITTAPEFSVSGLTGATSASRYVGATTTGAPASGTFAVGDFVIGRDGHIWVCTTAGTPGTWADVGVGTGGPPSGAASGALTGTYPAPTLANANLNAVGGLTSAANKVPYFTGSGTAAVADLTAAGRALIDDADATAQRATLSVYSIAQMASILGATGGWTPAALDIWLPTGTVAAGTITGGVIRQGSSVQLAQTYSQSVQPTDVGIGSALRFDWNATFTDNLSGNGPRIGPSGPGVPGASVQLQGLLQIGANQTRFSWSPIGFQNNIVYKNVPGTNRAMGQGWDFLSGRQFTADAATVTWAGNDSLLGGASFCDNQLWVTQNSGTSAAAASGSEIISYVSMPFILGNTHKTARVGYLVNDLNGNPDSVYWGVTEQQQTDLLGASAFPGIDNPNYVLDKNIGIKIVPLVKGTHNIGIMNASAHAETPTDVSITAVGNTLPRGAALLTVTASSALILTSTPTIADGLDGERIVVLNVGTNNLTLKDESVLTGSNLRIGTGLNAGLVTLAQYESITLRWSADLSAWCKEARSNAFRGQPIVDFPSGGQARFTDALSVLGIGLVAAGDAVSSVALTTDPTNHGKVAFTNGTSTAAERVELSRPDGTHLKVSFNSGADTFIGENSVGIRIPGDVSNRVALGETFLGAPSFIMTDGSSNAAKANFLSRAGDNLWAFDGGLLANVLLPINTITADHTLALTDVGRDVNVNTASNVTITIPTNASVAIPVGSRIPVTRQNTGTVTIAAAGGVTFQHPASMGPAGSPLEIGERYGTVELTQLAANFWQVTNTSGALDENYTTFSNAAYTALPTDRVIMQIGTMSASRTVTLPAASAVPAGHFLTIGDASGTVTSTFTIVYARAGSDLVNGGLFGAIAVANGFVRLVSDGVSAWSADTVRLAKTANLSDVASAATARTNLGLAIGTNVQAWDADLDTIAGLADPNADRMLFWDDSAGAYTYLTPGTNLTISGTTINAASGTPGINTVDNTILADMATTTIKGRVTAGTGDPEDLTAAQAKTVLAITESDVSGLVTDLAAKAPVAAPTFTGVVSSTGGDVGITDGTAAHGRVRAAAGALGPFVTLFGDSSDTVAKVAISSTGMLVGPGGSTAADFKILRTGTAAGAVTGVLSMTSPAITTPTGIVKGDVGLGSVDNTADTAKPVSTAQQTALNLKANLASPTFTGTVTIPTGGSITAPTGLVKGDVGLGNVENSTLLTATAWAAKGDLAVGTANDTAAVLGVGTFGQTQLADSAATTGLIYGNPESLANRYLKPTSSYETFSRMTTMSNVAFLASGTVGLVAIALPKNFLVTSITFASLTTAAVTPTNWWFALCDSSYAQLRATADQTTTAWAASTVKTVNLSSTFTTTYEGLHYVAVMVAAGTVPSFLGINQGLITGAPLLAFNGITAQTTARTDGTALASGPTAKIATAYAYVT